MDLPERVCAAFRKKYGKEPRHLARAPGRVNLLGEHVDYNDGFVLPVAIDRFTWIAFSPMETDEIRLEALDFSDECTLTLESLYTKKQADGRSLPNWAAYPAGVAWALSAAGLVAPGMQAVFASEVPRGAGLSSSASVEMAFISAWMELGGWTLPELQRARLGQKAENEYVGVQCGIMDQFASACGVAGHVLLLDCRSLEWEALPLTQDAAIVIADTSVRRRLSASQYNQRRQACERAVQILSRSLPSIRALRDVSLEDFNRLEADLPAPVRKRARHVVEEIQRTRSAIPLLRDGSSREFGLLMYQSHASLRDLYEVSTTELDAMVEIAQGLPGCYGARLTGAGFGGCTVNLVDASAAGSFREELGSRYQEKTGRKAEVYICAAAGGARLIG